MVPKPAAPAVDAGGLRLTWLKALNNSPRNWKNRPSVTVKRLANPRSHCCKPGAQMVSRPTVPYGVVWATKAAGLNHAAAFGLLTDGDTPGTTSARMLRSPPMAQLAHAGLAIVSGRPVRQFQIPSTCH